MGLIERLKEVGGGIGDLVSAPIGMLWDTARAVTSDQYNPGFFGVFTPTLEKGLTGIARIGEGTGLSAGIEAVGQTPFGEGLKSFWDEVELLYSTEFQRQQGQTPWGVRPGDPLHGMLGQPGPGDASIQRTVAGGLGAIGSFKPGGVPAGDFQQTWRRAAHQSIGQAFYESVLTDFSVLNPTQQAEVKASAHYNMITGTIDAVGRWFLSPDILLGKGLKFARNRSFILDSERNLKLAVNRFGGKMKVNRGDDLNGMRSVTLGADDTQRVFAVERSSGVERLVDEGQLRVKSGMDEAIDTDIEFQQAESLRSRVREDADSQAFLDELDQVKADLGPESVGDPMTDVLQHYLLRGLGPERVGSGYTNVAQRLDNMLAGVDQGSVKAMNEFLDALEAGGASPNMVSHLADQFHRQATSGAMKRASNASARQGPFGDQNVRTQDPPRFIGSQARPVALFDDYAEAKRYASALYAQNPSDMPVVLDIKANGLNAIYEEFDLPLTEVGGDGAFFTMAEALNDQDVRIARLDPASMDPATMPGVDLEPQTVRNLRLYEQDGRAIEPDAVIPFDDMRLDFETLARLNGSDARKYLLNRSAERNMGARQDVWNEAMSSRIVTQVLNKVAKMRNANEVRRVFFPDHPLGQRIAADLFDAKSFDDRRSILGAYMGYRLPGVDTLPDMTRARIDILLREMDNVRSGGKPNEVYLAMIDEPGKFTDLPPEGMMQAYEELLGELTDQEAFQTFMRNVQDMAPIRQLSMPYNRLASNAMRRTKVYQQSPLMRPVRVMAEMKPHRFINVRDGMSDRQLVRQLEEAAPLGVLGSEVDEIWKRYADATTDQAKVKVVLDAENLIIERAAKVAKLTEEEFQTALAKATRGRSRVTQYLESRRYSGGGRDIVPFFDDDSGEIVNRIMPMLDTQIQAWQPLADVRQITKVARRIGTLRGRFGPKFDLPVELLNSFYAVWKPTVLLRGGWMLRVVSDEQMRILARTGSLLKHLAAIEAGGNVKFTGIFEKGLTSGERAGKIYGTMTGTTPIVGMSTRAAQVIARGAEKLNLIDPEYYKLIRGLEIEQAVSARAAWGGPNESLLHEMQTMFGRTEDTIVGHFRNRATGQWHSVVNGSREFGPAWNRVLTKQFGESPIGRNLTENILRHTKGKGLGQLDQAQMDNVISEFKRFLRETNEGRTVADRMPWRSQDPQRWAEDLIEDLSDYTAGFNDDLMEGILRKKVTPEMMEAIDERLRPDIVHAEIIDQDLGRGIVVDFIRDLTASSFDTIGRMPTDTLSRQPFFKQLYAAEMMRIQRVQALQGVELTEDAIASMSRSARAFAINETKTLLYDLAEVSRFGDMMRFFTPFYAAWQEVIDVWAGLSLKDPSIIARAHTAWTAPNKMGIVYTDDDGQEFLQFRLSEKMADNLELTGWQRYLATGGIRVGKSSFNLVLNNPLPGPGPLISLPTNEIVKKAPELEASLKFLLPFGVSTDSSTIILSPLVRQLKTELEGPASGRSYLRAWTDAITWMDVEYRAGRRTVPPTEDEAHDIASKLHTIRAVTRLAAPAQPIFDSPLAPYIDIYRDMIDNLGPEGADEAFLNEYGQEFFAVTLSRSVSATGIPPTVEAEQARDKFGQLIEKHPEYGRLIIGDAALGEFSTAAYASQLERPIDPDNPYSEMERVYRPTELDPRTGTIMEVDRRLGWQEYIRAMDAVDLIRRQQGLPNLRVAAAEQLAAYRTAIINDLAQKFPSWWEDYNTRDELKWPDRISAFKDIVKNPTIAARPDMQGLQDYLTAREAILQELNRRKQLGGASTFQAASNEDLRVAWETIIASIMDENVAFLPLYVRYLEGDTLDLRSSGS